MKKTVLQTSSFILLILIVSLTSCVSSQSFLPVKGNGESVDRKFNVSDFDAIDVSGGFDVVLVQGNSEEVTLTAQENLFEYITVSVDQGTLKIYTENNIMSTRQMKARIAFKNIGKLRVSGGGDVTGETEVNVPDLDVELSGGGDLTTTIKTDELRCHISGGGDAKIDGNIKYYFLELRGGGDVESTVAAENIDCNISGGGNIDLRSKEMVSTATIDINGGGNVNADINAEKLNISVSGGGDATLNGKASEFGITVNGGGDILAGNFQTVNTSFTASGGSDVRVNASGEIAGQISGGGDVYYSGSLENISVNTSGGSEIHKE